MEGRELAKKRRARRLTQAQLGSLLRPPEDQLRGFRPNGVSQVAVSRWESGERRLSAERSRELETILSLPDDELRARAERGYDVASVSDYHRKPRGPYRRRKRRRRDRGRHRTRDDFERFEEALEQNRLRRERPIRRRV